MVSADVIEMSCVSVLNCLELLSSGHCISRRLVNKWSFSHTCECGVKQFCVNPGSRWGGALHSRRESDAGRRGPQALDWAAGEHPHLLGAEAVRQRDCAAAAAQVQALQVTTLSTVNSTAQHRSLKGRCVVTGVKNVSLFPSSCIHTHPQTQD